MVEDGAIGAAFESVAAGADVGVPPGVVEESDGAGGVEETGAALGSTGAGAGDGVGFAAAAELSLEAVCGGTGPMMALVSGEAGGVAGVDLSGEGGVAVSTVPSTPYLIRSSRKRFSIAARV